MNGVNIVCSHSSLWKVLDITCRYHQPEPLIMHFHTLQTFLFITRREKFACMVIGSGNPFMNICIKINVISNITIRYIPYTETRSDTVNCIQQCVKQPQKSIPLWPSKASLTCAIAHKNVLYMWRFGSSRLLHNGWEEGRGGVEQEDLRVFDAGFPVLAKLWRYCGWGERVVIGDR